MCSYVLPATCVLDSVSLHTCVRIHAKSRIWNTVVDCQDYQKRRFRPSAYLNWHAVTPWVGQCMEIWLIKYQTWSLLPQIKLFSCFTYIINYLAQSLSKKEIDTQDFRWNGQYGFTVFVRNFRNLFLKYFSYFSHSVIELLTTSVLNLFFWWKAILYRQFQILFF